VEQSRMMVDELQDLDKPVEYIELENGDHYLSIQRNRHTAFKAMETFLKTHLEESFFISRDLNIQFKILSTINRWC
jgi:dipeptidyl aminopeptidase/acylaminoacyl peptidase